MLNDLAELMEIESVLSEKEDRAPFGLNCRKALDWFLSKAESYGMKIGEFDGYCGFAEIGDAPTCIGVLCHLDVVPAKNGWSYPPYKLTIDNGYLYGRGVVDDKGPLVSMLHVLKDIKEAGISLKHRIRLIIGCNEENGSSCIKHYKEHGEIPIISIVPDADFPVINSEKGILQFEISIAPDKNFSDSILSIDAGDRANVVPDSAKMLIKKESLLGEKISEFNKTKNGKDLVPPLLITESLLGGGAKIDEFSFHDFEDTIEIESSGIAGHAMNPAAADNAIFKLFTLLEAFNGDLKSDTASLITRLFCSPLATERLTVDFSDKKTGALTINFAAIKLVENRLLCTFDLRLPITANKDEILDRIKNKLPKNTIVKVLHFAPNLYIEPTSKLVKTLVKIYNDITGESAAPMQIGGGTYARELPCSIAFGPTFKDDDTRIHNSDENVSVEHFVKWREIYYHALLELDKIDNYDC